MLTDTFYFCLISNSNYLCQADTGGHEDIRDCSRTWHDRRDGARRRGDSHVQPHVCWSRRQRSTKTVHSVERRRRLLYWHRSYGRRELSAAYRLAMSSTRTCGAQTFGRQDVWATSRLREWRLGDTAWTVWATKLLTTNLSPRLQPCRKKRVELPVSQQLTIPANLDGCC